ncbi:hypothetical protein [Variovorax paradoxus]|uniref:hypothetical protein n=1 Tax=Variovorax paradoxus TaxID=34073 RepID=UPI002781439C|nr:hypothetical protein [Variovorax paradoxus]MDQ0590999.1 hypothetical protein [Variovorax paradoxus]
MKFFCAIAMIAATASSAPALADPSRDLKAGLLGAFIGAVVNEAAGAPQEGPAASVAQQTPQRRPINVGGTVPPQQQAEYIEIAKQIYLEKQGDINFTEMMACREATTRFADPFYLNSNQCFLAVKPLRDARLAQNTEALERSVAAKKAADNKAVDAIVARAASGDANAIGECKLEPAKEGWRSQRDLGAADACEKRVTEAREGSLRTKTVNPQNCREWGVANGYDKSTLDASAISLRRSSDIGAFGGKITQMDGETLVIYNPITGSNSIVNATGSKVFGGDNIVVGSVVAGYGIQTGSVQGRLVSGQASTFAKITSKCIGGI